MSIPITPANTSALLVGLTNNFVNPEAREYISAMQARLTALEALSQQAYVAALMSESEWEALTPQSRHRINVFAQDAERLAINFLAYFGTGENKNIYIANMSRLATLLALDVPSVEHIYICPKCATGNLPAPICPNCGCVFS